MYCCHQVVVFRCISNVLSLSFAAVEALHEVISAKPSRSLAFGLFSALR